MVCPRAATRPARRRMQGARVYPSPRRHVWGPGKHRFQAPTHATDSEVHLDIIDAGALHQKTDGTDDTSTLCRHGAVKSPGQLQRSERVLRVP